MSAEPVLAIRDLAVRFDTPDGELAAVRGFSLDLQAGECVGVVGESGAGKSQALLATLGLLAPNARVSGSARFRGHEIGEAAHAPLAGLRGARIAMIFQDPMTSLTPHMRVGDQIAESLVTHRSMAWRAARLRAVELLERVQINDAARRARQYPHELSGGMRQRVMIAIALACDPEVLIADEPTTALDVTVQAQVLALLAGLKRDGMALVLVTHDLGVVAGIADRVLVMYAGRIVEQGPVKQIFASSAHPYTRALLGSMPRIDEGAADSLIAIPGHPPDARSVPPGCAFQPRCELASALCGSTRPRLAPADAASRVACHHPLAGLAP